MNNGPGFLMYQTENGNTRIQVRLEDETVWMTQKAMADLFQKGIPTINEHIKHIYSEGELMEETTIRKNRIVQVEGIREVEREVSFYNLEMIIAVGYCDKAKWRGGAGDCFSFLLGKLCRELVMHEEG